MNTDHRIRPALDTELDTAAQVLAAAFDTYPWTRWVLPEDGYAQRLEEVRRGVDRPGVVE